MCNIGWLNTISLVLLKTISPYKRLRLFKSYLREFDLTSRQNSGFNDFVYLVSV